MEVKLAAGEPFDDQHDAEAGWTAQVKRTCDMFRQSVQRFRSGRDTSSLEKFPERTALVSS